jgi:hypothetical protein
LLFRVDRLLDWAMTSTQVLARSRMVTDDVVRNDLPLPEDVAGTVQVLLTGTVQHTLG